MIKLSVCKNCAHPLQPNDWVGVCSVTLKTGCRWCLLVSSGRLVVAKAFANKLIDELNAIGERTSSGTFTPWVKHDLEGCTL